MRDTPVAILAGKTGTWGSGTVPPGWPCVVWAEDLPPAPKPPEPVWLLAVPCWRSTGSTLCQAWQPSQWHWPRGRAACRLAPAQRQTAALGAPVAAATWCRPGPGACPGRRPFLLPQCLAAAEPSSILPRGPWHQIRRGARLAATPHESRLPHLRGAAPGVPAGVMQRSAPRQQPLKVASWLRGRGWWPPVSSTTMPGCGTGMALAGQGGQWAPNRPHRGLGPDCLPGGRREPSRAWARGLAAARAPGDAAAQ